MVGLQLSRCASQPFRDVTGHGEPEPVNLLGRETVWPGPAAKEQVVDLDKVHRMDGDVVVGLEGLADPIPAGLAEEPAKDRARIKDPVH